MIFPKGDAKFENRKKKKKKRKKKKRNNFFKTFLS